MIKSHYLVELAAPQEPVKAGSKGNDAKRVQEWLNLWTHFDTNWQMQVSIDGDFGTTSGQVLKQFQQYRGLPTTGQTDTATWNELLKPLRLAFTPIKFADSVSLRDRVVAYAKQHLKCQPREFHPNQGPWVRSYMDGKDGEMWMWCVGFSQSILDMAYSSLGADFSQFWPRTFLANHILEYGKQRGTLVRNADLRAGKYEPQPGDMFLNINQNDLNQAYHVGLVADYANSVITTVEGNTAVEKGGNGVAVRMLSRNISNYIIDVVKLEHPV